MGKDLTKVTNTVFICNGSTCKKNGAEETAARVKRMVPKKVCVNCVAL